jgi:hypothetical protein
MATLSDTAGRYTMTAAVGRLFFEHESYGEDDSCCVYLDEHGNIVDYDYCMVIPEAVGEWLEENGFNVEWDDEDGCWHTFDREEV